MLRKSDMTHMAVLLLLIGVIFVGIGAWGRFIAKIEPREGDVGKGFRVVGSGFYYLGLVVLGLGVLGLAAAAIFDR